MRPVITVEKMSMTATEILARAVGLHRPLSEADREQIIDVGLADDDDFKEGRGSLLVPTGGEGHRASVLRDT